MVTRAWSALVRWFRAVRKGLDLRDLHFYGGVLLVAAGLWWVSRPWSLVVVGCVFVYFGLLHPLVIHRVYRRDGD